VQQKDERPLARLDVMQTLITNLGIALANLDPTGRHQVAEGAAERRRRQLRAHEISFLD
jgi:hypothetical protein